MKALVTGATGFVGSHVAEALLQRGDEVTALARSAGKAQALRDQGARVVPGDLHDSGSLESAVRNQDIVYHVAGVVAARDEAEFLRANEGGTRNVVAAADRAGVRRLILVSSMAAGGPSPRGRPQTGQEAAHPVTAYGRSKLAAERVVRTSTLNWSIVRPPMVYGPRDREVLKVFRLARLGIAPVFGDGEQELSAVHARDLAQALVSVALSQTTLGGTYVACHPEIFTAAAFGRAVGSAMQRQVTTIRIPRGLGRAILSLTGKAAQLARQTTILTADKANEFFQPAWTGDPGALARDTGWQAAYDLARGLADTYRWYQHAGWL